MIEAHIIGPHGSLYYSAPATPYDLENLRTHVSEADTLSPQRVRVELTLDRDDRALAPQVTSLVTELRAKGVAVRLV
ncbi:MAG TPA: hypothetical protein VGK30_16150 [Candidatus Binatia bacterium]